MLTDLMGLDSREILEKDMVHLRNAYKTMLESGVVADLKLDNVMVRKFRGDFNGLLNDIGVPPIMWPTITELNGLVSSIDFDGKASSIKMISSNDAESFLI